MRVEGDEAVEQDDGADYQIAMMRCLREVRFGFSCVAHGQRPSVCMQVNVDNNTVGWYQSTYLGSFLNETMIETQFTYQARLYADHTTALYLVALGLVRARRDAIAFPQDNIKNGVCLVYDPLKTQQVRDHTTPNVRTCVRRKVHSAAKAWLVASVLSSHSVDRLAKSVSAQCRAGFRSGPSA
jgi:hypothetical protein